MVEGLLEADREHTRRLNRLRTSLIIVAAILALLLCAIALIGLAVDRGLLDLPNLPFAGLQAGDEDEGEGSGGNGSSGTANSDTTSKPSVTTPQSGEDADGEVEGGEDEGPEGESPGLSGAAQAQDLSGTVRYSYSITASEGGKAQVTETVSFGKRGYAETSSMRLVFADEEAAKAFMERVERSYGTTYLGGTRTGAVAEVRIDVADGRLDRAAYKQELAKTAQGLTASEETKDASAGEDQDTPSTSGASDGAAQIDTQGGSKQPSAE